MKIGSINFISTRLMRPRMLEVSSHNQFVPWRVHTGRFRPTFIFV